MNISQFKKLEYQDYRSMTTEELTNLVRYGANVLNRRINALYRAQGAGKPFASDALEYVEKTGGLFNLVSDQMTIGKDGQPTFSKDRTELLKELKREIYFANLESSTVKGSQKVFNYRKSLVEDIILKDRDPEDVYNMSQKEINELIQGYFEDFKKLLEEYPNIPYGKVKEIYDTHNSEPEVMKEKLEEIRGQMHDEEAEMWRRASEETGYMPKWESF